LNFATPSKGPIRYLYAVLDLDKKSKDAEKRVCSEWDLAPLSQYDYATGPSCKGDSHSDGQEIPYGTHNHVYKSPSLAVIFNQINPIHTLTPILILSFLPHLSMSSGTSLHIFQ
jgi:hypothetical protein